MALVLDAGALIAVDRKNRAVGAMLRVAHRERIPVRTSSAVVAQVWRDGSRQAILARLLAGTDIAALQPSDGRRIGELLGRGATSDVVDGHIALLVSSGDVILTGDVDDITGLLRTLGVRAAVGAV